MERYFNGILRDRKVGRGGENTQFHQSTKERYFLSSLRCSANSWSKRPFYAYLATSSFLTSFQEYIENTELI